MKRTYSNTKRETIEISGNELRVYWDETVDTIQDTITDESTTVYSYFECVLPSNSTPEDITNKLLEIDSSINISEIISFWESMNHTPLVFRSFFIHPQYVDSFTTVIENITDTILAPGPIYTKENRIAFHATAGWVTEETLEQIESLVEHSIITPKDPYTIMRELQLHK